MANVEEQIARLGLEIEGLENLDRLNEKLRGDNSSLASLGAAASVTSKGMQQVLNVSEQLSKGANNFNKLAAAMNGINISDVIIDVRAFANVAKGAAEGANEAVQSQIKELGKLNVAYQDSVSQAKNIGRQRVTNSRINSQQEVADELQAIHNINVAIDANRRTGRLNQRGLSMAKLDGDEQAITYRKFRALQITDESKDLRVQKDDIQRRLTYLKEFYRTQLQSEHDAQTTTAKIRTENLRLDKEGADDRLRIGKALAGSIMNDARDAGKVQVQLQKQYDKEQTEAATEAAKKQAQVFKFVSQANADSVRFETKQLGAELQERVRSFNNISRNLTSGLIRNKPGSQVLASNVTNANSEAVATTKETAALKVAVSEKEVLYKQAIQTLENYQRAAGSILAGATAETIASARKEVEAQQEVVNATKVSLDRKNAEYEAAIQIQKRAIENQFTIQSQYDRAVRDENEKAEADANKRAEFIKNTNLQMISDNLSQGKNLITNIKAANEASITRQKFDTTNYLKTLQERNLKAKQLQKELASANSVVPAKKQAVTSAQSEVLAATQKQAQQLEMIGKARTNLSKLTDDAEIAEMQAHISETQKLSEYSEQLITLAKTKVDKAEAELTLSLQKVKGIETQLNARQTADNSKTNGFMNQLFTKRSPVSNFIGGITGNRDSAQGNGALNALSFSAGKFISLADTVKNKAVTGIVTALNGLVNGAKNAATAIGSTLYGAITKVSGALSIFGNGLQTVGSKLTAFNVGLGRTKSAADSADSSVRKISQSGNLISNTFGAVEKAGSNGFNAVRNSLIAMSGSTVITAASALKMAGDYEQAKANLVAVISPAERTADALKQIDDVSTSVGLNTSFSSKEAADGLAEFAQQGLNLKESLVAIVPAANAAELNNTSLADAAQIGSVAMNAFGLNAGNLTHIFDVQTKAAQLGTIGFDDFGQGIAAGGAVAKLAGESFETFSAALVGVTNSGLKAQDAGTSLKTSLQALMNPTAPATAAMKELGLSVYDAKGNMKELPDIIDQLNKGTAKMSHEQRDAALSTIFGSDGIRAMTILMGMQGQEIDKTTGKVKTGGDALRELIGTLQKSDGALKESHDIVRDTFNAAMDNLGGSVQEAAKAIGNTLLPRFKDIVNNKTGMLNTFTAWENETHTVGTALLNFFNLIFRGFQIAGDVVKTFISALRGEWMDGSQINRFTAFFGKLGSVIYMVAKGFAPLVDYVKNFFKAMNISSSFHAFDEAGTKSAQISKNFANLMTISKSSSEVISRYVKAYVVPAIADINNAFVRIKPALEANKTLLLGLGLGAAATFLAIRKGAVIVGPVINTVTATFGLLEKALIPVTLAIKALGFVLISIGTIFNILISPIGLVIAAIAGAVAIVYNASQGFKTFSGILEPLNPIIKSIGDAFNNLIKSSPGLNAMFQLLGAFFTGGVNAAVANLNSQIKQAGGLFNFLKGIFGDIINAVANLVPVLAAGTSGFSGIQKAIDGVGNIIKNFALPTLGFFLETFRLIGTVIGGTLLGAILGLAGPLGDTVKHFSELTDIGQILQKNLATLSQAAIVAGYGIGSFLGDAVKAIATLAELILRSQLLPKVLTAIGLAFTGLETIVGTVVSIIQDNIKNFSDFISNFADGINVALAIVVIAIKAIGFALEQIMKPLSNLLPVLGFVAAAWIAGTIAMKGAEIGGKALGTVKDLLFTKTVTETGAVEANTIAIEANTLASDTNISALGKWASSAGGIVSTVATGVTKVNAFADSLSLAGKAIFVIAPAFLAWQAANALTNGELDKTKDNLIWLITHQDEVTKVLGDRNKGHDPIADFARSIFDSSDNLKKAQQAQQDAAKGNGKPLSFNQILFTGGAALQVTIANYNKTLSDTANLQKAVGDSAERMRQKMLKTNQEDDGFMTDYKDSLRAKAISEAASRATKNIGGGANLLPGLQNLLNQQSSLERTADMATAALDRQKTKLGELSDAMKANEGKISLDDLVFKRADDKTSSNWQDLKHNIDILVAGGDGAAAAGQKVSEARSQILKDNPANSAAYTSAIDDYYNTQVAQYKLEQQYGTTSKAADASAKAQADAAQKVADSAKNYKDMKLALMKHGESSYDVPAPSTSDSGLNLDNLKTVDAKASELIKSISDKTAQSKAVIQAQAQTTGEALGDGFSAGISTNMGQSAAKAQEAMNKIIEDAKSALGVHSPSTVFMAIGNDTMEGFTIGIEQGSMNAAAAITNALSPLELIAITSGLNIVAGFQNSLANLGAAATVGIAALTATLAATGVGLYITGAWIGSQIVAGMAQGINANAASAATAAVNAAQGAATAAQNAVGIHSPSTVFAWMGQMMMQGMAIGITDNAGKPVSSLNDVLKQMNVANIDEGTKQLDFFDKISSTAGNMVESLKKLSDFKAVSTSTITAFVTSMRELMKQFNASVIPMKKDALDAANNYFDMASKVASVLSAMADAFDKLKEPVALSTSTIKTFVANVKEIIVEFSAAAIGMKTNMISAANVFAETATNVSASIKDFADTLIKLEGYTGPSVESIRTFVANINEVVLNFMNYGFIFSEDMAKAATSYSDTAKTVGDTIGTFVDSLSKLVDWVGPADVSIQGFVYNMNQLMLNFMNYGFVWNEGMSKAAVSYSATAKSVADTIGGFADTLPKLLDWVGIANVSIEGFVYNIDIMIRAFNKAATDFGTISPAAEGYLAVADKVSGIISNAADGLVKLRDLGKISSDSITDFVKYVSAVVDGFKTAVGTDFKTGMYDGALAFADIADKSVGLISNAVDGFEKLGSIRAVSETSIATFVNTLYSIVTSFKTAIGDFHKGMFDSVGEFGTAASGLLDALSKALDVFKTLAFFVAPSQKGVNNFVAAIYKLVDNLKTQLGTTEPAMFDATKSFGEATSSVFDGLKSALDVFTGLNDFKGINQPAFDALKGAVIDVTTQINNLTIATNGTMYDSAKAFGDATSAVFGALKDAIDVFNEMANKVGVPIKPVLVLLQGILFIIGVMAKMEEAIAGPIKESANGFATAASGVFTSIKGALDTLNELTNYKGDVPNALAGIAAGTGSAINYTASMTNDARAMLGNAITYRNGVNQTAMNILAASRTLLYSKIQAQIMGDAGDRFQYHGDGSGNVKFDMPVFDINQLNIPDIGATYSGWGTSGGNSGSSGSSQSDKTQSIVDLADTIVKLGEDVSKINRYVPVNRAKVDKMKEDISYIMSSIYYYAWGDNAHKSQQGNFRFTDFTNKVITGFASTASTVVDLISKAADSLGSLKKIQLVNQSDVDRFVNSIASVMNAFMTAFNGNKTYKDKDLMDSVSTFASTVGNILDLVNNSLEAFTNLGKMKSITSNAVNIFDSNITSLMNGFIEVLNSNTTFADATVMDSLDAFTSSVASVIGIAKDAPDAFVALGKVKSLSNGAISTFDSNIKTIMSNFIAVMNENSDYTDKDVMASVTTFSTGLSGVFSLVKDSFDVFNNINRIKAVNSSQFAIFNKNLKATIDNFIAVMNSNASYANSDAMESVKNFSDAIASVFSGIDGVFSLTAKVNSYQALSVDSLTPMFADISTLMNDAIAMAASPSLSSENTGNAVDVFTSMESVFTSLASALQSIYTASQLPLISIDVMDTTLANALKGYEALSGMVDLSYDYKSAAQEFADNMNAAASSISGVNDAFAAGSASTYILPSISNEASSYSASRMSGSTNSGIISNNNTAQGNTTTVAGTTYNIYASESQSPSDIANEIDKRETYRLRRANLLNTMKGK